ncbi:DNA packaging protein [Brevibacillus laterosporus]|uniref:DNA packaging protein n=1 Tax=Brevibacillus laterosporus TaxID=1465 RepID=UPI0014440771|nr:DNA packaging protein [Brevibacillus laterosporus]NKQ20677.1 DNA packaging protein [Brevibacillus laterosporus]WNX29715.1 DNA packaging protein [Brevibacillus laterosporus]
MIEFAKEIKSKIQSLAKKNKDKGKKAYDLLNDFERFAAKCLKIKTKEGKLLPFVLNDAQRNFAQKVFKKLLAGKPARFIILKARQMGFSTVTEAIIYYLTSLQEAKNGFIVAQDSKASDNLFAMFKNYYENVPNLYKPMRKRNNSRKLSFENPTSLETQRKKNPGLKSEITVDSAEASVLARSGTIHFLHVSELAFWPESKKSKHMLALLQSLSDAPGTLCIIESTANGYGEYFQQMWDKALKGKNDYEPIFVAWHEFPTYREEFESQEELEDFIESMTEEEKFIQRRFNLTAEQMKWRRSTIKNKCDGDPKLFAQEYPAYIEEAFLVSGRSVFDQKQVGDSLLNVPKPIREDLDGAVLIWAEPEEGELYDMGADVAEGLDGNEHDSSTFVIWKRSTGEQVAEMQIKEEPFSFAALLNEWGRYYNNALLGVERNNHGHAVLLALMQIFNYPNLYEHKDYDVKGNVEKRSGWPTTPKTRPILVEEFRQGYVENEPKIKSKRMLGEMRTFVKKNGKAQHQTGCHDDVLFAGMIGWEMRKHPHRGQFKPIGFSIMPDFDAIFS